MFIVWGSRFYGKTDVVPGLCHVATRFGHLWFISLIPLESAAVIEENSDGWRGARIPMSLKSVLLGWIRGALTVVAVAAGFVAILSASGPPAKASYAMPAAVGLGAAALAIASLKVGPLNRASYHRAQELGQHLGLDDRGREYIDTIYGYASGDPFAAQVQRGDRAPDP